MISFTRILVLAAFFCLCTHQIVAQPDTKSERSLLTLSTDAHQQSEITTVLRNGVRYVSVDDLARFISARTYANTVLKKVEIILPSLRFKCTADNPFIIITRQSDGTQTVAQLTLPVVYSDGVFLLPADEFLNLYENRTGQKILLTSKNAVAQKPPVVQKPASEQLSVGSGGEKGGNYSVTGMDVEEKRNGFLLRIHTTGRLPDAEKTLQGGQWLYLTIPKAKGNLSELGGLFSTGFVKRVIPVQSADGLQLSFQFREKVESAEIIQERENTDILIALRTAVKDQTESARDTVRKAEAPPAVRQPSRNETNAERQKNKWKLDVIVLDAGHGGHDPGAIGSMGTREKNVTLGIALKLGALIEKNMPGVKVVYTRKADNFVELFRRGQIANEAGGKLFISIHCNSAPKKSASANGFEIYLLRPGKTENAIEIAEQENAVVRLEKGYENRYQKLTDENFIILTMAQSAFVKQSERFAEMLESEMAKKMVYQSRGVKQAGFYVLVGASMPNILVETGYLSNRKDETLLRGLAGQYLAAQSIYDGLKKFKAEYERNFAQD